MYTWGYLKGNILAKLNLSEQQANEQGFLSRFPYYANEAMTQICSSVKAKEVFFEIDVLDKNVAWCKYTKAFNVYTEYKEPIEDDPSPDDEQYKNKVAFWEFWNTLYFVDEPITFPEDFISFNDDVAYCKQPPIYINGIQVDTPKYREVGDEFIEYYGYNQVRCHKVGSYRIPYNARWFFFTKDTQNDEEITAPADVCDAIPSYVVGQCLRIDDEVRAQVFRNEYEIFLARIDDTTFKAQRTLHIGGGW